MNKFTRRFAAVLTTGALVAGGLALTASAANADVVAANVKLFAMGSANGTIASKQITSGSSTVNPMYYGITIDQACPANYRSGASIQIAQGGVRIGGIGSASDVSTDGTYGSNGLKASDTGVAMDESFTTGSQNPYVDNNKSLEVAAPSLVTGSFEVRYYCLADNTSADYVNDKFFSLTLNFDKTAHTWSVPVAKIATTTAITAQANNTASPKTATINTTIKNADGSTAAASSGSATVNQTYPTAATLGTVTIANGLATYTSGALTAGTYSFTVTYLGDTAYNGSTSSSATVTISGSKSGATNVTFAVAQGQNQGDTTLSGVPTTVDLGTPQYNGTTHQLSYNNQSAFSGITVTDYRSLGAANWSLTGSVSDFTSGVNTLSGKYLGWTPALTSGPTGAAAGSAVSPAAASAASTGGLKSISQLSTAPVVDGSAVTVSAAALYLTIPANSTPGTYSGVLTLTLA